MAQKPKVWLARRHPHAKPLGLLHVRALTDVKPLCGPLFTGIQESESEPRTLHKAKKF